MQKELNPELFGPGTANSTRIKDQMGGTAGSSASQGLPQQRLIHHLEQKIAEANIQTQQAMDQIAQVVTQVNEFIKASQGKMDRFQVSLKAYEQHLQILNSENSQKFTMVHQRMNERKTMDVKMQEMMDRHNSILKSYEVRLSHLQTLISQKEAQIQNTQMALNEAKMEISRLKRM